jgi:hypothetical protein
MIFEIWKVDSETKKRKATFKQKVIDRACKILDKNNFDTF